MPKERFHLYLTGELLTKCAPLPAVEFDMPAFSIGAVSPDIFYYDLPSFSLSPLGDALHALIKRQGISVISDWIARTPPEAAGAGLVSWALGFACHFLADAAWHPVIEEFSRSSFRWIYSEGERLSEIQRHRLLESELEAFWLGTSPSQGKYDGLLRDLSGDRGRLLETASCYRRFLEFAGETSSAPGFALSAEVSDRRIARCFLCQNFLLRLFANRTLSRHRDRLLSFPPTRFLGSLVTPGRPVLPAFFQRALPEDQNPFSGRFMEQALTSLERQLCGLAKAAIR